MAEVVAELESTVQVELRVEERSRMAVHALLAGIVVAQLAWVAALVLVAVALIR